MELIKTDLAVGDRVKLLHLLQIFLILSTIEMKVAVDNFLGEIKIPKYLKGKEAGLRFKIEPTRLATCLLYQEGKKI